MADDRGLELECLRPHEVAAILGISREQVLRHLRAGRLPGIKIGALWVVPRQALEQHLRRAGGGEGA